MASSDRDLDATPVRYGPRQPVPTKLDGFKAITSLEEAQAAGRLQARLKVLTHPALLVVDEIAYLTISRTGAMLFFQLMTRRYEHAYTVLASNKGFEDWGEVFGDDVMAAALIDRLVHHCHIVTIRRQQLPHAAAHRRLARAAHAGC